MKKQPNGFTGTEFVITLAVFAFLVFGGWFVWRSMQNNTNETPTNNTQKSSKEKSEDPVTNDPTEGGKYLVIEEWGVRFPLPEELRGDVEYGIFTDKTGEQSAHFAIGEIDRLPESNCELEERVYDGGKGVFGGIASIFKKPDRYPVDIAMRYDAEIIQGDYWYYIGSMRDSCFSAPGGEFRRLILEIESLANAIQKLEPTRKQ